MPVKKATRSTRSTRTTKASSKPASSDLVLDENIDATSELKEVKKKKSKSSTSSKMVLGERNAPNSDPSSPLKSSSADSESASQKTSKSKKSKKAAPEALVGDKHVLDYRSTTPIPSSPTKKRLPEDQVQACLQNYDLENQARVARLRASLEISIQSSITRMRLAIERIPRAVRELTLAEFIDEYNADLHTFMGRAPVQHLKDTQEEWDQIREERSPVKAKRSKKDNEIASVGTKTKSARTTNPTASSSSRTTTSASTARGKKPTRTTKASSRATSAAPTSPLVPSKPAPSLSKFQPDLPKQALRTPKPRVARPGEIIQYQSINGSPICGIIGEDGVVRPVTFA
ncbi:uncharacterized protein UBRO_00609 [Ustilago bromivora]|uniref:Borealin N-terminal domain-containing protein n=1 Tax=Ustilago bromivora TaxID=307758 RepID=A0A1K0FX72_9BASI|nr:uncharacterized protein UBRO_00609 [Ustilago bromivora]SYW81278.1 uncharacterized protein UBRO2_04195 [Ustilago bromivora]